MWVHLVRTRWHFYLILKSNDCYCSLENCFELDLVCDESTNLCVNAVPQGDSQVEEGKLALPNYNSDLADDSNSLSGGSNCRNCYSNACVGSCCVGGCCLYEKKK